MLSLGLSLVASGLGALAGMSPGCSRVRFLEQGCHDGTSTWGSEDGDLRL